MIYWPFRDHIEKTLTAEWLPGELAAIWDAHPLYCEKLGVITYGIPKCASSSQTTMLHYEQWHYRQLPDTDRFVAMDYTHPAWDDDSVHIHMFLREPIDRIISGLSFVNLPKYGMVSKLPNDITEQTIRTCSDPHLLPQCMFLPYESIPDPAEVCVPWDELMMEYTPIQSERMHYHDYKLMNSKISEWGSLLGVDFKIEFVNVLKDPERRTYDRDLLAQYLSNDIRVYNTLINKT